MSAAYSQETTISSPSLLTGFTDLQKDVMRSIVREKLINEVRLFRCLQYRSRAYRPPSGSLRRTSGLRAPWDLTSVLLFRLRRRLSATAVAFRKARSVKTLCSGPARSSVVSLLISSIRHSFLPRGSSSSPLTPVTHAEPDLFSHPLPESPPSTPPFPPLSLTQNLPSRRGLPNPTTAWAMHQGGVAGSAAEDGDPSA